MGELEHIPHEQLQPLASPAEQGLVTQNERRQQLNGSIANIERNLEEAKAAADITADPETRAQLEQDIAGYTEALEHLREEAEGLENGDEASEEGDESLAA